MPKAPLKHCTRCLQGYSGDHCDKCEKQRQREVNTRRSADKAFYDSKAWKSIRIQQLSQSPFCVAIREDGLPCRKIANHVDHIIPREKGGSDGQDNLQSLCAPCHSRKTALYDGGFGNR